MQMQGRKQAIIIAEGAGREKNRFGIVSYCWICKNYQTKHNTVRLKKMQASKLICFRFILKGNASRNARYFRRKEIKYDNDKILVNLASLSEL